MDKEKEKAQPICAEEALNLLNCVTDSPFDQDKCLTLLNSLRNCVLHKKVKKFSLAEQSGGEADATLKKHN